MLHSTNNPKTINTHMKPISFQACYHRPEEAYLFVNRVDKLSQSGQRGANVFEAGLGLAPAEVRQGPCGVAEHRQLRPVRELLQEGAHRPLLEDEVAADRRVAGDVAQRPYLSQKKTRRAKRGDST